MFEITKFIASAHARAAGARIVADAASDAALDCEALYVKSRLAAVLVLYKRIGFVERTLSTDWADDGAINEVTFSLRRSDGSELEFERCPFAYHTLSEIECSAEAASRAIPGDPRLASISRDELLAFLRDLEATATTAAD